MGSRGQLWAPISAGRIKAAGSPSAQEGGFSSSVGEVLSHLGKWLTAKYTIDAAYRSYADRVKGPWRDSLVDHWYAHAKEERRQGYDLAMRIVSLGGDPIQTVIEVPASPANLGAFCLQLMGLELKAIENGHVAIRLAGANGPLRVLAEQIMLVDSLHLDDLRRMCSDFEISMLK